jgi:hypothetical protein
LRTSGRSIVTIATGPSVSKEMFMGGYLQHFAGEFDNYPAMRMMGRYGFPTRDLGWF